MIPAPLAKTEVNKMVVGKRAVARGSSSRARTDRRAHFGEERIPSPKKKRKKKKTKMYL